MAVGKSRSEITFVVEEAAEGGFVARALGTSIFTEADSLPQLHLAIADAVDCHFDGAEVSVITRLP